MKHRKVTIPLIIVSLITVGLLCTVAAAQAAEVTQADFVVGLASKLGLGQILSPEEAAIMLTGVGIVPDGGWQLGLEVSCELVAEIQILAIKSAQMGLIRYAPEDVPLQVLALSDELGCCPPPKIVEILPAVSIPPPPIAAEVKGGGSGGQTTQTENSPTPSPSK